MFSCSGTYLCKMGHPNMELGKRNFSKRYVCLRILTWFQFFINFAFHCWNKHARYFEIEINKLSHFFFELGISLLHSRLFSEIHRRGKIRNFHQDIQRNTINIKRLKWLANVTLSLSQHSGIIFKNPRAVIVDISIIVWFLKTCCKFFK